MELKDLFVSHKLVDPVYFAFAEPSLSTDLYSNYDRASKVVSTEPLNSISYNLDMSTWVVGENNSKDSLDWKVNSKPNSTTTSKSKLESWNNPYKNNKQLWKKDLILAYKKAGLNDNAIKNLVAKNAFESGWGQYALGAYNFGNITTGNKWSGKYVDGKDKDADGNSIVNKFRVYDSLDDYVEDEIQFLTNLYDFNVNDDFETFIEKLQGNNAGKRRYAEDNQYATKVRMVYNSI